jgi:hypothetical protein
MPEEGGIGERKSIHWVSYGFNISLSSVLGPLLPGATGGNSSDDESVFNDDVTSNFSEESTASILKDADGSSEDSNDAFEEKLSEALELASSKSAKDRTKALEGLCIAFSKKYIPWFIDNRWVGHFYL